jgi:hypothetical protein
MRGIWYDGWTHPGLAVQTDAEFFTDYQAAMPEEQFRSFCFWLGAEGENI